VIAVVWEYSIHIIVRRIREVENVVVKCGTYWTDTQYGPLRLEFLSTPPAVEWEVIAGAIKKDIELLVRCLILFLGA
jgi:hypothetical protein